MWFVGCIGAIITYQIGVRVTDEPVRHVFADVFELGVDLLVTSTCYYAARRGATRRARRAWTALTLASAVWTAGTIVQVYLEVVRNVALPFPSSVDYFGWAGAACFALGIVLYNARDSSRALGVKQVADLALVSSAIVAVAVEALYGPAVEAKFSTWYVAAALFTPVINAIALVYGLITWQYLDAVGKRVLAPILVGSSILVVVDVLYASEELGGRSGTWVSNLGLVVAFLIATGARLEIWGAGQGPAEPRPVRSEPVIPAVAILVWVVAIVGRDRSGSLVGVEAVTGVVLAIALGLRIWATQRLEIELESRLAHVQRLEAVGTLAGGVAHDFNNVLGAATAGLKLVRRKRARGDDFDADLVEIEGVLSRAADLTAQLLDLSRKRAAQRVKLDPVAAIERVRGLLERVLPGNVRIATDLPSSLPNIEVDPSGLEAALLNLGLNARDALRQQGGTITFGARLGESVILEVRDDGPGIPANVVDRVFEPFFTTKAPGEGTGLGLAMVEAFVVANGGVVVLDNVVGRGATFRIGFPRSAA